MDYKYKVNGADCVLPADRDVPEKITRAFIDTSGGAELHIRKEGDGSYELSLTSEFDDMCWTVWPKDLRQIAAFCNDIADRLEKEQP